MTDIRQALEEAFATIHNLTVKPSDWDALGWDKADRFRRFLDAEAWTDAAMMLPSQRAKSEMLSEARRAVSKKFDLHCCYLRDDVDYSAEIAHALLAALKAKEQADG